MARHLPLVLLLVGCDRAPWTPFIDLAAPPALSISSPTASQAFATGDTPRLVAWASDDHVTCATDTDTDTDTDTAADTGIECSTLTFELIVDGEVWPTAVTASTFDSVTLTAPLPGENGAHQLTLSVKDAEGQFDRATLSYTVGDPTAK